MYMQHSLIIHISTRDINKVLKLSQKQNGELSYMETGIHISDKYLMNSETDFIQMNQRMQYM